LGKQINNYIIYPNVELGKNPIIEPYVILGKPKVSDNIIIKKTIIGDFPTLRSGTIIYYGNKIGMHFQTGDNARIRENNIIGDYVSIGTGSIVENECNIADNVKIHSNCFIPEFTILKENSWVGPNVTMTNVLHPPCPAFKRYAPIYGKKCCAGPIVEKNAIIGGGSVLLPGVIIGENALIGAGSVVTKDISPNVVAYGNPAKMIKRIEDLTCPLDFYRRGVIYSWRKK